MTVGIESEKAGLPMAAPEQLTLAGVSDDRRRLLLVDDRGTEFTLAITPALRAALRGDATRLGQLEIRMDNALRPKDIQTRIRAGESPETVAQAAGTTVDKIMPFVGPVLAEREHVAERAQRSNVRKPSGEAGGAGQSRTLGEAVATHLRSLDVDPAMVEWDAWRREDGRWTLAAAYELTSRTGTAHFTFDTRGNYVVLDDEDARWLVGEIVPSPAPARDDLRSARERRLGPVAQEELPLGDDAIELVSDPPAELDDPTADSPVGAFLDDSPASDDPAVREEASLAADSDEVAEPAPEPEPEPTDGREDEPPSRRPVQKKKGRASVPSWDEIMFGGSDQ